MTAPTPVSALLHAATLVTAGMFLLLRSGNVLANYFQLNHIIFSIAALTALISGLTAVFQSDIKKLEHIRKRINLDISVQAVELRHYRLDRIVS